MEFTCEKNDLFSKVKICMGVLSNVKQGDINKHIFLNLESDNLYMSCRNNFDLNYKTKTQVNKIKEGKCFVYAEKFASILASLPDGDIHIEHTKENEITIKHCQRKIKFKLFSMLNENFPTMPNFENINWIDFTASEIKKGINQTWFACSDDITRLFMTGVYFEFDDEENYRLVGTNGRRLSYFESDKKSTGKFPNAIVPTQILKIINTIAPSDGDIKISINDKTFFATFGDEYFSTPLISGQFPNWRRVVPDSQNNSASVDVNDLRSIINRAATIIDKKSGRIYFDFENNTLTVSTQPTEHGNMEEEIPCEYTGEKSSLAFNIDYVSEVLTAVEDKLEIEFSEELKPVTFNKYHIIAPMHRE